MRGRSPFCHHCSATAATIAGIPIADTQIKRKSAVLLWPASELIARVRETSIWYKRSFTELVLAGPSEKAQRYASIFRAAENTLRPATMFAPKKVLTMDERRIHQVFEVSVLLKGAHAATECIGGLALALMSNTWVRNIVSRVAQTELAEDKQDLIANHLAAWVHSFSIETQHFYAWYLLSHGVVKLALVAGLLRRKLWAYPTTMIVLGGFILYQLYRYTHTHGLGLLLLTALDIVVVGLTWHEYNLMRRHLPVD